MSGVLTQTTIQDSVDSARAPLSLAAIRWVFPLPALPPVWLDRDKLNLGRDPEGEVVLTGGRVSRQHAQISRSGPLWLLNDLESKKGVFVNGKKGKSAAPSPGDVVRIGGVVGGGGEGPRAT